MRRRARVYYSLLSLLALRLAFAAEAEGQVGLTTTAAMTKGPAKAPVTIVEFSDYQ